MQRHILLGAAALLLTPCFAAAAEDEPEFTTEFPRAQARGARDHHARRCVPARLLGARYFQEIAPGVALDRAEHVTDDLEIEVPAGDFDDCVEIEETTALDPDSVGSKSYCPGTGLMNDGDLELVSIFERR